MDKQYIRDFHGRIIGSIETNGTKQIARDFYLKILVIFYHFPSYITTINFFIIKI